MLRAELRERYPFVYQQAAAAGGSPEEVDELLVCALRVMRTGAGACWECGEPAGMGATELEADYEGTPPQRFWCAAHVPAQPERLRQFRDVDAFMNSAAAGMGL